MNPPPSGQTPQQPAGQRPPPMYQPGQIKNLPTLTDEEKLKYEQGLRTYWTKVNNSPPTSQEHITAKAKIIEFSKMLIGKIQQRRLQLQQQQQQQVQSGQQAQPNQGQPQQQSQSQPQQQPQSQSQPQQPQSQQPAQPQAAAASPAPNPTQTQNRPTSQQNPSQQPATNAQAQAQQPAANGGAGPQGAAANPAAPKGQPPGSQAAAAQKPKLPDNIIEHVKTLNLRAPPSAPDPAKWIAETRERYGRALQQMDQTKKNVGNMEKYFNDRKSSGRPFSETESAAFTQKKEQQMKSYAEAHKWIETLRKQQGLPPANQTTQANQAGPAGAAAAPAAQTAASTAQAPQVQATAQNPAASGVAVVEAAKNQQAAAGGRASPANGNPAPVQPQTRPAANVLQQNAQPTQSQPQAQPPRPEQSQPPPVNAALAAVATQNQTAGTPTQGPNRVQTPQASTPVTAAGPTRALSHSAAMTLANQRAANTPGGAPVAGQQSSGAPASPAPGSGVNQSVMGSGAQHQQGHPHAHPTQSQQSIQSKMPIPKQLPERATAVPQGVVIGGGVNSGRPTVSQGSGTLGGVMNQPVVAKIPAYSHEAEGDHVLSKKKLDELVRQVCGGSADGPDGNLLTPDVEENVLSLADSFLDNVLHAACKNAKERGSKVLEIRDIQLILERAYNIRVPGYSSDELRTVRKIQPSAGWIAKMSAVQAAKVMPEAMPGKTPNSNGKGNVVRGNKDVEMKDSAKSKGKKPAKDGEDELTVVVPPSKASKQASADADGDVSMDGEEEKVDPVAQTVADIKSNFALLDRAVVLFDPRFSLRAMRSISLIRKRLTPDILAQVIVDTFPANVAAGNIAKSLLLAIGREHLPLGRPAGAEMEVDSDPKPAKNASKKETKDIIPEIDIFLGILVQVYLFDSKDYKKGADFSNYLADRVQTLNRRTLDSLSAKVYFYFSLFCEHIAPLPPSPDSPIVAIRPTLLAVLRTAVLRKDIDTQASVIVLLLRNYLLTSHISQADLLVSHTQFPENAVNNQVARFLYYLGRIRAIQLRYTEAHEHLTAATRKAPSSNCAVGFSQTATKLLLVVELLMGDIPDRATFRQPSLEDALHPYFLLVQAVRVGNLENFEIAIADHADTFRRDGTYTLILRLRQNVIKTGIRMMSLSYSRISLRDICIRLHLGSEESAEYIVAKAIRDGVIEATLDRERGFMKSKEVGDVYATREPGEAFHDRIRACLALHDESVKAMRFPMNQHRLELKNAQEAREREREMAKEIQEGDLDEDDLGGDFEGM
ncbi:hypothetical protein S40293_04743 [Stachybotrys chartarum IBT 40293]|nr:hypothetical protein S40293_04743 [Stachybotrys chartarum IBT 40293]